MDVLLVEDSPPEVELMLRPFRELDPATRVGVAGDGEEALDYLMGRGPFRHRVGAPLPRLVLLPLKLAKLDGLDVLRALRANPRTAPTPVVMLTSAADPRELAQCYQLGANSCVRKPVDFGEFRDTIRALGRYWLGVNQPPPAGADTFRGR